MKFSRRLILLVVCVVGGVPGQPAMAFTFVPTPAEWGAWPDYCRAKYSVLTLDMVYNSGYFGRVSPQEVEKARSELGKAWDGVHHHCAGLANMQRAMASGNPGQRNALLRAAYGDTQYSYNRIDASTPLFGPMAVQLGLVARAQGKWALALQHFETAVRAQPESTDGYQGMAMVYRDRKDFVAARDILVKGNEAVAGSSAELHYTLGLVLVDLREFEAARQEARLAYELGYPLPGLRRKLDAAGYPLD
jgi:tetratricopeptide (TPR) repeat protein